jgi:hypothetical protein
MDTNLHCTRSETYDRLKSNSAGGALLCNLLQHVVLYNSYIKRLILTVLLKWQKCLKLINNYILIIYIERKTFRTASTMRGETTVSSHCKLSLLYQGILNIFHSTQLQAEQL